MTEKQELINSISDDYKSLHGCRPHCVCEMFSLSELREWYADLREEIEASIRQRESEQAAHEAAVREAMTPTPEFTLGELL